jgi:hypothetical protein
MPGILRIFYWVGVVIAADSIVALGLCISELYEPVESHYHQTTCPVVGCTTQYVECWYGSGNNRVMYGDLVYVVTFTLNYSNVEYTSNDTFVCDGPDESYLKGVPHLASHVLWSGHIRTCAPIQL